MKISIITVVYNNEATIHTAIESVLNQTYKDIEYIIIDGLSKDNTLGVIKQYQHRGIKVVSEPDKGLYDAMNKGVAMATGDVIGLLNSDDIFDNNEVISKVAEKFISDPLLEAVYGDIVYVNKFDTDKVVRRWKSADYFKGFFENGNVPPHPALYVSAAAYKKVGLYNIKYKLAADYEFMLRLLKKHNARSLYIPANFVKMRLGGESNKSIKNIINANKEVLAAWRDNGLRIPLLLVPKRIVKRVRQFF